MAMGNNKGVAAQLQARKVAKGQFAEETFEEVSSTAPPPTELQTICRHYPQRHHSRHLILLSLLITLVSLSPPQLGETVTIWCLRDYLGTPKFSQEHLEAQRREKRGGRSGAKGKRKATLKANLKAKRSGSVGHVCDHIKAAKKQ